MIWLRRHRSFSWTGLGMFFLALAVCLVVVRSCDPARAEWLTIDKFGGVNADLAEDHIPVGDARYAVGVYMRSGELVNGNYLRAVGISYISGEECRLLGQSPGYGGIIFDNGWLQLYNPATDSSYLLEDTAISLSDTAHGIRASGGGNWDGAPGDMLSKSAGDTSLAKFAFSSSSAAQITQISGGAMIPSPISCIYSEKYLRIRDTGLLMQDTGYYWKLLGTPIGNHNVASLSIPDTAWFFNGQAMSMLTSKDISTAAPQLQLSVPDTGTVRYVSSSAIDTVYGQVRLKGTAATFHRADRYKYVYFQDTSIVYTGRLARIFQFDSSAAGVYFRVLADTSTRNRLLSRYAASPLRIQIFTPPTGDLVTSRWYWFPAEADSILKAPVTPCSTNTTGTLNAKEAYANVNASKLFGPVDGPKLLTNPRSMDNTFWVWFALSGSHPWHFTNIHVYPVRKVPGSTTHIRVLFVSDSLVNYDWNYVDVGDIYKWSGGFAATGDTTDVVSKTSHWTIVENHRGRAFYSGNQLKTPWDSTVTWAYSYPSHYDSIQGIERFEGEAPVIGLSSMGSNMIFYRARPPNAIQSLSGFSNADFYMTPLTAGVGAVSDQSIARNPLDESDYFVNNLGMWRCDGSSVTKVETKCESIFRDSINWAAEKDIAGVIFDNHYWLAAPFGTSEINDRLLTIDLESGAVTFAPNFNGWIPGSMKVLQTPGLQDRMFAGASDTGQMFRIAPPGTYAELNTLDDSWLMTGNFGEWRSGWMDFGDPGQRKRINNYEITFQGHPWVYSSGAPDSIIVSFYNDFSGTAAWSDRIAYSGLNVVTRTMPVPGSVQGRYLSFGIQFKGSVAGVAGDAIVTRFGMDWVPTGTVKPR